MWDSSKLLEDVCVDIKHPPTEMADLRELPNHLSQAFDPDEDL